METIKQRREKLIEERVLPNLIKETEEYLIRYGGVSFERGNEEEQMLRKNLFPTSLLLKVYI